MNKIIYILGTARSGSTLLSILLGNSENVFDAGELIRIPELKGLPRGVEINSETAMFWNEILKKTIENSNSNYNDLYRDSKKIESHFKFISSYFNLFNKSKSFQKYTVELLKLIKEKTNKEFIIDASKYPGRALFLGRQKELNVFYIYLKRDPVSVVKSFAIKNIEQPRKRFIMANLYYFIINLFCNLFLIKICKKNYVTVKFNELIKDPLNQLERINYKLNGKLILPKEKIINKMPLKTGNMFDGNRLRLKKEITIEYQEKENKLSFLDYITLAINKIWY